MALWKRNPANYAGSLGCWDEDPVSGTGLRVCLVFFLVSWSLSGSFF